METLDPYSLACSAEQYYEPNHNYNHNANDNDSTTIPRKSVNMVAELALWIPDTTERQEDYSAVAKATTMSAVALDTKARAAQRTVIQLKSELAQSQQSRTEAKTQADYLSR